MSFGNEDQEEIVIKPQKGPQEDFLASRADIVFYGGAAGGGKSYALLIDPLRHIQNPLFRGVLFRRDTKQLKNPGGLWDESSLLYPLLGGVPNKSDLYWTFPHPKNPKLTGMEIKLAHLYEESNIYDWQGAQLAFLGFDEVTHFTEKQFFYLISRVRSMSGVPGYVRATCNPDPDSWVATFIEWWIDQDTGLPIPERAGKIRWFIRVGDEFIWANKRKTLIKKYWTKENPVEPKSVTFIPAKVTDNKILLKKDPTYLSNLMAQNRVDRARLRDGNWKVRELPGELFQRGWFEEVETLPTNIVQRIRYWDRAATKPHEGNKDPDWTVGLKLCRDGYGTFYIEHVERFRDTPLGVKKRIAAIASQDGTRTKIGIEKDPGQAGVSESDDLTRFLAGYITEVYPVIKDKVTRAKPASAQVEAGNVKVLKGAWNERFYSEAEAFPDPKEKAKDDQVDAFSGAFHALTSGKDVLRRMTTT